MHGFCRYNIVFNSIGLVNIIHYITELLTGNLYETNNGSGPSVIGENVRDH